MRNRCRTEPPNAWTDTATAAAVAPSTRVRDAAATATAAANSIGSAAAGVRCDLWSSGPTQSFNVYMTKMCVCWRVCQEALTGDTEYRKCLTKLIIGRMHACMGGVMKI